MTAANRDVERKVIPRWHAPSTAARHGELSAVNRVVAPAPPELDDALRERIADWNDNRSLPFAGDLVSSALVQHLPGVAEDAIDFLKASDSATLLARRVAEAAAGNASHALGEHDIDDLTPEAFTADIRRFKRLIREDPRSAVLWAEVARRYAALGQREQANRAMQVAIALAPNDRFVLRSASRLFLHLREPDRAHELLVRAPRTQNDPWLLAAEIAIAPLASRESRLIKHGRRVLDSRQFSDRSVSELATAIGTEALQSGKRKDARKMFERAVMSPTENAVAQLEWAARQEPVLQFQNELLKTPDSFEARAQVFAAGGDQTSAAAEAWSWLTDQPFASMPAIFGSYHAALNADFDRSIMFARAGLLATPTDFFLRNNLVFALASRGDLREALDEASVVDLLKLSDPNQRLTFQATQGLLAFRDGRHDEGRALYRGVIAEAQDSRIGAIAAILLAREEAHAHTAEAARARAMAAELASQAPTEVQVTELKPWIAQIPDAGDS